MEQITPELARWIALGAQGLASDAGFASGKLGAAQVIGQLGYIQIDSIAVIQRSHHHTLWTRVPSYRPEHIEELNQERLVFEYWRGPAASYLPMQDYRYHQATMERYAASGHYQAWLAGNQELADFVLKRLTEEGALSSSQFDAPAGFKRGTWWNRKPAKIALEMLFSTGRLMVSRRNHFARVYDLAERVLPDSLDLSKPTDQEIACFAVQRALQANGIISAEESPWHIAGKNQAQLALEELAAVGRVVPVSIRGKEGAFYTAPQALSAQASTEHAEIHLIAPFDNLIIARSRLLSLFGYDYHLECYLPTHKRKLGYYSLPMLWGDQFVGRLDPKADRKTKTLLIHHIEAEGSVDPSAYTEPLARKLAEMAHFNACERVVIEKSNPPYMEQLVTRQLHALGV
ncbi:MAG: winged helix DNA-binding domain-containing protein [Chloroflexi bacterium]|nr:winged helix DNA-binding domain-containing protein [Chloroflexota bacterium]